MGGFQPFSTVFREDRIFAPFESFELPLTLTTVDQTLLDTAEEEEEDHLHLHHLQEDHLLLHLMYRQGHQLEEGDETRVTNPSSPSRTTLTTLMWETSLFG